MPNSKEEDYKKVDATIYIQAFANCPYCGCIINVFNNIKEDLPRDSFSVDNIDVEVKCNERKCGKIFIIENVEY